jgi:VWFA-related protein
MGEWAALYRSVTAFALSSLLFTSQQQPTFRAVADTVAIYATVREANGRLVPNLTRDDFLVYDNGRPAPVTTFSNEVVPMTAVLMLDMSGSMLHQYKRIVDAASHFIDVLLPADRVRLGSFGDEVAVSPLLIGDKAVLHRVLREEFWPGNNTPLWEGLQAAMHSLDRESGRRVVIALTDGRDGCQCENNAVAVQALAGEFLVYAVSLEGSSLSRDMSALVDATGGGHFDLGRQADLGAAFAGVVEELHSQYAIGIASARDGQRHTLKVLLKPAHLTAQTRQSYQAVR